jgi:hypothetical protein
MQSKSILLLIFSPFKTTFRISTLSLRSGIPISKASGRRWRIASSSSEGQLVAASNHHLCILYKNIINESGQARPMNKSHFHKSYMKCILASHCIERLHKCSTCFKSKNSRSVVNTSHNAMNSSFMPHDL